MHKKVAIPFLRKCCTMLLVSFYLVVPLKNFLLETAHAISHTIQNQITQSHLSSHHHYTHSHDSPPKGDQHHEHSVVSFFSTLLSLDHDASEPNQIVVVAEIDKHFLQDDETLKSLPKYYKKQVYYYSSKKYSAFTKQKDPPPKSYFS